MFHVQTQGKPDPLHCKHQHLPPGTEYSTSPQRKPLMLRNKPALDSPRGLLISSFSPLSCSTYHSFQSCCQFSLDISMVRIPHGDALCRCCQTSCLSLSKLSLTAPDDPGPCNSENFRGHSLSVIEALKAGLDEALRRLV